MNIFNRFYTKLREESLRKEGEIVETILEEQRTALDSAYHYIKSKVTRKLEKIINNPSLDKLHICLAIRSIFDSMDYTNVHDYEVLKITYGYLYSGMRCEDLVKVVMDGIRCGKKFNAQRSSLKSAIEFVKQEFGSYDYKGEGRIESMALVLLFKHFCWRGNTITEAVKEFVMYTSGIDKSWSKEETIKFIADHFQVQEESRMSIRSSEVIKSYDSRYLNPISENIEFGVQSRGSNVVNKSQASIESCVRSSAQEDIMKIIAKAGLDDDTVRCLGYGHKCASQRCLLCKKNCI